MDVKEHGEYSIEVKNGILYSEAKGPFNEWTVKSYSADVKKHFPLLGSNWNHIVIFFNMGLFIPEAAEELMSLTAIGKEAGMKNIAFVLADPQSRELTRYQHEKLFKRIPVNYSFHETIESADAWIIDQQSP